MTQRQREQLWNTINLYIRQAQSAEAKHLPVLVADAYIDITQIITRWSPEEGPHAN